MAREYVYTFSSTSSSVVTIDTSDRLSQISTPQGTFSGYAITKISGTFQGQAISGESGPSGQYLDPGLNNENEDNFIFTNASDGVTYNFMPATQASFDGIDNAGAEFKAGSTIYNLYTKFDNFHYTYGVDSNGNSLQKPIALTSFVGPTVCYRAATQILTSKGQMRVEALSLNELVVTASGAIRQIRWLGSRKLDCRTHPDPCAVWPVRIAAHAFGESRPARDLYVSPGHAICVSVVDDVLIPASALVNGSTITQVKVDTVTYWHVELDKHDVLLAENLPAESYRDVDNRGFFVECPVVDLAARPDGPKAAHAESCLPLIDCGPILDAVRIGLRSRALKAGWTLDEEPFASLHVVADGVVVQPDRDGLTARFVLPASATDVCLVSETSVPFDVSDNPDRRRLGVSLRSLTIDDGMGAPHVVSLDDARLDVGFHAVERPASGERRWTDGRARLPASLWEGSRGAFFLRVELTGPSLPRWVAPHAERSDVVRLLASKAP